ncbi:MAG: carboxymuconolactone decarboxylase family protein [Syntrophomonadaceae bacterium]|nr:carboxymuconolactone decarboxylase family protein [Syntrophomonadaceae bacterium]
MEVRIPWFVEKVREYDEEFHRQLKAVVEMAMKPGALDARTKFLIALALDALKGAEQGVKVLAGQAREAGATDEQIAEAVRLAYFVAGMDVVKTSLKAFED